MDGNRAVAREHPEQEPASTFHLSRRDKTLALAGTLAALLMAGLDQTIVATAGPQIQRDLSIPASLYAWITTAYLVTSTVMLPIYGKLSDLLGRKPVLLAGVALFLLGSVLCGFATSTGYLIGARAVQGLGAASLFTSTLAVIADLFPPHERGKYMGLIAAVMGISSVIGPVAGGVITDLLGWHWVFFINLPIGLIAMWLVFAKMPALGGRRGAPIRIDFLGAFWLVAGVVPLLIALSLGRAGPGGLDGFAWTSVPILAMLAGSGLGLSAFLVTERRVPEPIIDLSLFLRNRTVGLVTLTMFVLGATFLFTVIFIPLFLVNVVGVSATRAGLSLTPLTLGMVATSVLSGQLASRTGKTKAMLLGALVLLIVAFAVMGFTLTESTSQMSVSLKLILIGMGLGPTMPLYPLLAQNAARPQDVGVVTAGSIFARSLGQVIGLALFGTLFATTLTSSVATRSAAVLAGVAPETREVVSAAVPAVGALGEGGAMRFDAAEVEARVSHALETAPSTSSSLETRRAEATRAVGEIQAVFRSSLTGAVAVMYRVGLGLLVVALLLTAVTPVAPMRPRP
jgi:EmrB/QacA subfamily drug resistance transporter